MEFEHEFDVAVPVERVYAYLLDVDSVATCMPGAELSERVDADTFRGKVRIKVGAITVSYDGTARITERDRELRTATLAFDARERSGGGSARAMARMAVEPSGVGSRVKLTTEVAVAGRVATFGRNILEDVSRRLVEQMAGCIRANLESEDDAFESAPAAPISVFRLLAAMLRDRGRRLLGRPPTAA